jgi:M6 family metalloprotease-like protein
MSLTKSPRYPEMQAWSTAQGFAGARFGVPVLSNGGNTATFTGTATAPTSAGEIKVWTYARDFRSPNGCTGDLKNYKNSDGANFVTLTVSNNAATNTTLAGAVAKDGEACTNKGDKSAVSGGYLECRTISGNTSKWFKLSSSPSAVSVPTGGSSLEACKLTEARINKFQPWNIGFPRGSVDTPMLPSSGVSNIQLVAVDFSDAVGTAEELTAADTQISEYNKWFAFTSKGSLSFNWQYPKRWLRMSRPTQSYALKKGDPATVLPMAQEIVSLADPFTDFSNSDFVFVLFPKTIQGLNDGIGMHNWRVETAEGPVKNLFGGAEYFYKNSYELWSFWIHEWGHPMGLAGHSPRSNLSIMDDQNGRSVVLNVWDTFFAGWMGADELYCMPSTQSTLETQLIPLERLQRGMRGVIVPISATEALVVESHRAEGWGARLGAGTYGLLVYYVDTTKDTDRSGETQGIVREAWSKYVTPTTVTTNPDPSNALNKLLLQGESVTYKGITVTLTKTGDVDTVRITK